MRQSLALQYCTTSAAYLSRPIFCRFLALCFISRRISVRFIPHFLLYTHNEINRKNQTLSLFSVTDC